MVKGTTTGVITDLDGKYSLSKFPDNATLQFSFVGMISQEIKVGTQNAINMVLEEESIGLEEVVAIGYGTVKKSYLTGAVGSVKGSSIAERQTSQLSQALQGSLSGVTVTRSSGNPSSGATIQKGESRQLEILIL